jgi:hypothetical protein
VVPIVSDARVFGCDFCCRDGHQCGPRGPAALAVGGIGPGEQCVAVNLSVLFRTVCGMSGRRFRRIPGGVCLLGLQLVWCPEYRGRILGGRVAARCGEVLEQVAAGHGGEIMATEVMPDHGRLLVWVGPTDAPARVVGRSGAVPYGCCVRSFGICGGSRKFCGRRGMSSPRSGMCGS